MMVPIRLPVIGILTLVTFASHSHPSVGNEIGIFALTANRQYHDPQPPRDHPRDGDLAYREFVRQAFLLSAREEFGFATRDETLLESVDRDSPETFDIVVAAKRYHGLEIKVSRDGKVLQEIYVRDMLKNATAYQAIAHTCEWRSHRQFAGMLEKAGYTRQPNKWHASKELSPETEALLLQMNSISQFRAIREIHHAIRLSGESPERLAGLVRGYSNLAQFTTRGVDCRGIAFRCRAWLYAERLRRKTEHSNFAEWHWVYMAIMAGQPTQAKEVITKLKETEGVAPEWGKLMEYYCDYRYEELEHLAQQGQPFSELATVVNLRANQQLNSNVSLIRHSQQAIERVPDCLWIHEQMYQVAGVSLRHKLTRTGPQLLADQLRTRLPTFTELPPEAKLMLDEHGRLDQLKIARLALAIVSAGQDDRDEPSLEVLGRNIEAVNVLHIFRIAHLWKVSIGADANTYIDEITPAVKDHELYPLLQTYKLDNSYPVEQFEPIMKDYEFKDGNSFNGFLFFSALPEELSLANMRLKHARNLCWHGQMEDEEAIAAEVYRIDKFEDYMLEEMKWVSNNSPMYLAAQILHDKDAATKNEAKWLNDYGHYPTIRSALGEIHAEKGNLKKAVEHLEIAVDTLGDYRDIKRLASVYYQLGDDLWLPSIKRVLEREDYGLEHSHANGTIANTLMSEGKFDEALPYAVQASQAGSEYGYRTYLECLTGLGQWAQAEQVAQISGRRYHRSTWFDWCVETGKGDIEAAWEEEQRRLSEYAPNDPNRTVNEILYLMAVGQKEQALKIVSAAQTEGFSTWMCMQQAMLADELGDDSLRNEALTKLNAFEPADEAHWTPYRYLAGAMLRALLEDRSVSESDIRAIRSMRASTRQYDSALRYFAGTFNWLHAKNDERTAGLERIARLPDSGSWTRALAWVRLREAGIDPIGLSKRRFSGQFTKSGG